jgi:outer membrane receptor protein involved in Fe transport
MNKLQVLFIAAVVALGMNIAFAQATSTGTVLGVATDKTGAVIVGADVTLTSKSTGAVRTATSSTTGDFRFDQVAAGPYVVKVSKTEFASYAQSFELLVNQTVTVSASLKLGQASEVVEVTGDIQLIDQAKTSVSQEITPKEIVELPMLGRDAATLAYLVPGVKAADSYDPTKNRAAVLSVNGQGGRNVNVTVNGIDNKDNTVGGTVMQLPLEAVEEFNISTQRFSASNGRSEGAAINLITKSGSNNYHGSLFGLFRDTMFNADYKLADGTKDSPANSPAYARQQFGGSFGGPVIKDKLFAFFAYERQREHTSLPESGDRLTDLNLLTAIGAKPAATIPTPFFETRYNGRLDYQINRANKAYLSYTSQGNNSQNDQADGTGDLTNGNFTTNQLQLATLNFDTVISPTTVNQLTFGYQYWNNNINTPFGTPYLLFPSGTQVGTNANVPQQSFQRKWQFKDDISKTWGKHTFRTGFDYIWEQALGGYFKFTVPIEVDLALDPTQLGADAASVAAALATPGQGNFNDITFATGDPQTNVPGGTKQLGLYFQDDWKLNKRLTLNLGIRWDRDFNMVEGSAIANSRTYQELVAASSFSNGYLTPFISKIAKDDTKNFSPRIGFAYDLTGRGTSILRGGYGLYYGNIFQNIPIFMEQQHNATIFQSTTINAGDATFVPGFPGVTLDQFSYTPANIAKVIANLPAPSSQLDPGSTGHLIDPNYKNPVTEEFNIGWSQELSKVSSIEAEYIHVLSLHENKTVDINPNLPVDNTFLTSARPLDAAFAAAGQPVLGTIRDQASIGRSRYDGFNFSYHQRLSHHFTVNASYTLAWAQGYTGASSYHSYPKNPLNPLASADFGPSPNDERHHITVSGLAELPWKFQLAPILQFGSARPYDLTPDQDYQGFGESSAGGRGVLVPVNNPTDYTWSNRTFKQLVAAGSSNAAAKALIRQSFFAGNGVLGASQIAKFDPLRGDPTFTLDMRLAKNVKIKENVNLQFIAQAFDLTNRANYGNNFNKAISSKNFATAVGFINPSSQLTARSLSGEFGFRLSF